MKRGSSVVVAAVFNICSQDQSVEKNILTMNSSLDIIYIIIGLHILFNAYVGCT